MLLVIGHLQYFTDHLIDHSQKASISLKEPDHTVAHIQLYIITVGYRNIYVPDHLYTRFQR